MKRDKIKDYKDDFFDNDELLFVINHGLSLSKSDYTKAELLKIKEKAAKTKFEKELEYEKRKRKVLFEKIFYGGHMKLEERVKIVTDMCEREIKRQEVFMALAEKKDDDREWLRRYDLQGLYQTVLDILTDNYDFTE